MLRLLSAGEPVPIAAAAAGAPDARFAGRAGAARVACGVWDDHGRVSGFGGLTLAKMAHRIRHAGVDLYAWYAWDPLFLTYVIGDLQVTTADPVTGEAITYRAGPDGAITGTSHPGSVLSFLRPGRPWDDDVMTSFCHYVLHLSGPASAEHWTAAHPATFVISLGDAAELGAATPPGPSRRALGARRIGAASTGRRDMSQGRRRLIPGERAGRQMPLRHQPIQARGEQPGCQRRIRASRPFPGRHTGRDQALQLLVGPGIGRADGARDSRLVGGQRPGLHQYPAGFGVLQHVGGSAVLIGRDRPADQGVQAGADRPVRGAAEEAMSAPRLPTNQVGYSSVLGIACPRRDSATCGASRRKHQLLDARSVFSGWAELEEIAARLLHSIMEAQLANLDIPLSFDLTLLVQLTAALPDPGGGRVQFRGRQLPLMLGFRAAVAGQVASREGAVPEETCPDSYACQRRLQARRVRRRQLEALDEEPC